MSLSSGFWMSVECLVVWNCTLNSSACACSGYLILVSSNMFTSLSSDSSSLVLGMIGLVSFGSCSFSAISYCSSSYSSSNSASFCHFIFILNFILIHSCNPIIVQESDWRKICKFKTFFEALFVCHFSHRHNKCNWNQVLLECSELVRDRCIWVFLVCA